MQGNNPIRPPISSSGESLFVQEIYPTIQTEGFFSGYPAVFLRLGGCNLACKFCDTEFESFSEQKTTDVINKIIHLSKNSHDKVIRSLVVITGGEPLRQNIRLLTDALLDKGYAVQIETNGTIFQELDARVHIVCSPKAVNGKYSVIRQDLKARIDSYKILISERFESYSQIPGYLIGVNNVYIQPIDEFDAEKNKANLAMAVGITKKYGFKISRQYHKILGLK